MAPQLPTGDARFARDVCEAAAWFDYWRKNEITPGKAELALLERDLRKAISNALVRALPINTQKEAA